MSNPDLLSPGADSSLHVPPLAAITKPMGNTKAEGVWFFCTMSTASFHRQDGKKLPFLNHMYKAETKQDIAYLDYEIQEHQNQYLRRATEEEVNGARMRMDPIETIKDAVRNQVESEFSIEQLQALIEKRRKDAAGVTSNADQAKIEGVDKGGSGNAKMPILEAKGSGFTGANTASLAGALKTSTTK